MVTITLYTRQQKRHWCIEQSFGLCGRGRGWDDLGEWHWNMYNIIYEASRQSRFDAPCWMLGACALGWPRGMVWGGRKKEGSGRGTHVLFFLIKKKKKKKKESWAQKNRCFWTVVLNKSLESPLDCREIQPVHPQGNQSLIFIGRTDAEAETPIFWPPDAKSWLIWKDPDAGKDWGQEEKGITEDEMVGWHPRLNGHGFG